MASTPTGAARKIVSVAREAADITQRAVAIHVKPRPWSLRESRAVLQILQGYGEVLMYKHLVHQLPKPAANRMIVFFRDPQAAAKLIDSTPIEYSLDSHNEGFGPSDVKRTEKAPVQEDESLSSEQLPPDQTVPPPSTAEIPFPFAKEQPSSPPDVPRTTFILTAAWSTMNHLDYIAAQPYFSSFAPNTTMAQEDLGKKVPYHGMSAFEVYGHRKLSDRLDETQVIRTRKTLRQVYDQGLIAKKLKEQKEANAR